MSRAKPRNVTNYMGGLYAEQLPLSSVSATRDFLKVSDLACDKWGTAECLTCPLQEWTGSRTPWCGAGECSSCAERASCCCGNEELRMRLWKVVRLWEADRLRAALSGKKEVRMKLPESLRV